MEKDDEKVVIQSYEFWSSIAEEESIRLKNKIYNKNVFGYCDYAWSDVLNISLGHLKNRKDIFDDEWNTVKAVSTTISIFSQVVTNFQFLQIIIDFVGSKFNNLTLIENIGSQDPIDRDSSLLVFASILDTSNFHKEIITIVENSLGTLIPMLNDPDKHVRKTCSWCIERIAETFPEILDKDSTCGMFVEAFINHLKSSNKVITHLCNAIHYFANYLKPHPEQVSSNKST